jgi:hypothetical protein
MNTDLQRTDHRNNNSLVVITNAPLMYYPDLRDVDVHESKDVSKEEKQVILASLNYPKIRNLNIIRGDDDTNNTDEYDVLVNIIAKAIWDMGITEKSMTKEEQLAFIPIGIEEIKEFDMLTIEDVRICFKRGSRRKYGDFFQMSITTINCWLTAYVEGTKPSAMMRLPYIKKVEIRSILEIIKEEGIIISNEELKRRHEIWITSIYQKFEDFKVSGNYDFVDFGNKFFNYCKKLGLIKLNEKQQEDLWNRAVKQLKDEYHPVNGRTFGKRVDLKNIYESLKNPDEIDKKTEEIIVIRAKKLTVMYFFKKLINQKKELKDVIVHQQKILKEKINGTGKKTTSDKKD